MLVKFKCIFSTTVVTQCTLSTTDTTSLDQNKLYLIYCTIALSLRKIYDDVMPMNDTRK